MYTCICLELPYLFAITLTLYIVCESRLAYSIKFKFVQTVYNILDENMSILSNVDELTTYKQSICKNNPKELMTANSTFCQNILGFFTLQA